MRLPLLLILPVLVICLLVDWYICRAVWLRCKVHAGFWRRFALWTSVLLNAALVVAIVWPKKSASDADLSWLMWSLYAYFSVYVPKLVFIVFDLIGKIPTLFKHPRLKALGRTGIALAVIIFGAMWWGALINRYNIDVREVDMVDPTLPEAFDGLRLVQISDIHTGSFGTDTAFVAKLVDRANALGPDMIVFTGDVVNRKTAELTPFISPLSRLSAPMGVYSILGNHDYGDYYRWETPEAKEANMKLLRDMQRQMKWQLLDNESRTFRRGADSLVLIGVENIGDPPFPRYGNLEQAYKSLGDSAFKVLLSHNPAHWTDDIELADSVNIALTLAGHTHAMQITLPGGWSPASFRYRTWGGLYGREGKRLYVNIGAGEVGIPARIGATPEITVITLRRSPAK